MPITYSWQKGTFLLLWKQQWQAQEEETDFCSMQDVKAHCSLFLEKSAADSSAET
jgi:hypothetical protein